MLLKIYDLRNSLGISLDDFQRIIRKRSKVKKSVLVNSIFNSDEILDLVDKSAQIHGIRPRQINNCLYMLCLRDNGSKNNGNEYEYMFDDEDYLVSSI